MEFLNFRNTYKDYWEHFKLHGVSDVTAARFESLLHVCDPDLSIRVHLNGSKVSDGQEIVKNLREIAFSVDDSMLFCKFRNEIINCSSLFHEVVTPFGVCFSFNMLSYNELFKPDVLHKDFDLFHHSKNSTWSLDDGFESDDLDSFPFPIISQ